MTYGRWTNEVIDCQHPRGGKYYWMVGHFHNDEPEAVDTDQWASITTMWPSRHLPSM